MDKCPNCKKDAVEKDQCLACGIIVSRWLKLHSAVPPDKSDKNENIQEVYPHLPPSIELKRDRPGGSLKNTGESQQKQDGIAGLQPPDFILEPDATVPISESPELEKPVPLKPMAVETPRRTLKTPPNDSIDPASGDKNKKENKPFFAQTEADVIKLKKELKTDWEEYYATRKERYHSSLNEHTIAARFRMRNLLICLPLLVLSFFAADVSFLMRFGITAEYSSIQPLISITAIASFFLSLAVLVTLKPSSAKTKIMPEGAVKLRFHPVHIIEIALILLLIVLMPFKPTFKIDPKSEFPILAMSDEQIEFLTGEGLGNFIRPVFGKDGRTVYAVHLYGNSTGFIVALNGLGSYKPVFKGAKITKFRLVGKDSAIYLDSDGLHKIKLTTSTEASEDLSAYSHERVLAAYTPSDFDLSRDGRTIIFCSQGDIWISKYPFKSAENATNTPSNLDVMPSFFPDGNGFLFISDMIPSEADASLSVDTQEWFDQMAEAQVIKTNHSYQVFSYSFAAGKAVRIVKDEDNYYYPVYSPDMSKIAVVIEANSNITLQTGSLNLAERAAVIMKPDGSGKYRIFPPLDMPLRAMHEMCWSTDGRQLLIGVNALLQKGIYRLTF